MRPLSIKSLILISFVLILTISNHINADSAVRIGLLPKKLKSHIVLAGNSSLGGAVDSLLNPDREEKVIEIAKYRAEVWLKPRAPSIK